jgi:hypothetical protein
LASPTSASRPTSLPPLAAARPRLKLVLGTWRSDLKCSQCGKEHAPEDIELFFKRPDEIACMERELRDREVKENDDLCMISESRFFIRGVLPLPVNDWGRSYNIGLWVEVEEQAFGRVCRLWSDPNQQQEPPFPVSIANSIRGMPNSLGLPAELRLTGPTSRPSIHVVEKSHPLFSQQAEGISAHQAYDYTRLK